MRPVRLRSSRKFCPRDFFADNSWRRMTSRSGGKLVGDAHCAATCEGGLLAVGKTRRKPDGGDKARRIGAAGAGDIERRAVIRRRAHERQAKRDIDGVVEGERLDRDQGLIVVHAKSCVVGARARRMKHGVRRQWAARIDAIGFQARHRGRDHVASSIAHGAILAGMWIEPRNGEAGARDAEAAREIARHDAAGLDDEVRVSADTTSLSGRWIVTGTTASSGAHSIMTGCAALPVASAASFAEKFGVAGLGKARAIEHVFGDRIGHERAGVTGKHIGDGQADRGDRGRRAAGVRTCPAARSRRRRNRPPEARSQISPRPSRADTPDRNLTRSNGARRARNQDRRSR